MNGHRHSFSLSRLTNWCWKVCAELLSLTFPFPLLEQASEREPSRWSHSGFYVCFDLKITSLGDIKEHGVEESWYLDGVTETRVMLNLMNLLCS